MTRKDYVAFAKIIAGEKEYSREDSENDYKTRRRIAHQMAGIFKADNSSFDRDRFLEACKVVP